MAPRRKTPMPPLRKDRRRPESVAPMFSSRVYEVLGPPPRGTNPNDAKQYHTLIVDLLAYDDLPISTGKFSRSERQGLQRLERRWRRRADGKDRRWNLVGARAGRLYKELEAQTRPDPDPAWEDPNGTPDTDR